jgi:ethanolamine utilization protein EutQ (cupin superfamily)
MAMTDEIEFMHEDELHLVLSDSTIIAKLKDV